MAAAKGERANPIERRLQLEDMTSQGVRGERQQQTKEQPDYA